MWSVWGHCCVCGRTLFRSVVSLVLASVVAVLPCAAVRGESSAVKSSEYSVPSAAFTASPTTSRVSVFFCGRVKTVKFVGMPGMFQVKCPMCIAVDAPGAILQMQFRCLNWSRR
eukprot:14416175-Ditylum_brightwellii.AAC.1